MANLGRFCKYCECWEFVFQRGVVSPKRFGLCDHPSVPDEVLVNRTDEADADEKVLYTEQLFGCLYFSPKGGNLVTRIPQGEL